jgi:hypothetical protein
MVAHARPLEYSVKGMQTFDCNQTRAETVALNCRPAVGCEPTRCMRSSRNRIAVALPEFGAPWALSVQHW